MEFLTQPPWPEWQKESLEKFKKKYKLAQPKLDILLWNVNNIHLYQQICKKEKIKDLFESQTRGIPIQYQDSCDFVTIYNDVIRKQFLLQRPGWWVQVIFRSKMDQFHQMIIFSEKNINIIFTHLLGPFIV